MRILAIETSCDDTCIAVLEIKNGKFEILSNIVSSQVKLHEKYGGVYPFLAKREHQRNLPTVLNKALRKAGFVNPKSKTQNTKQIQNTIDLIAITVGPGLEPCLWTGINFTKELAEKLKTSIIPVNHIEGHILANWLPPYQNNITLYTSIFPAVCLVVSGGHTQLILMKDIGNYKILGETRDDAAGECFDKTARILGLGYPGGPVIAAEAAKIGRERVSISLPRPMIYQKNYDFSFSGLKTAVLYLVKKLTKNNKNLTTGQKIEICAEIQQAIVDVLVHKTIKATKDYKAKSIILGGGVAANEELRKQLKQKIQKELPNIQYLSPDISFCTDNAAMVAAAAYYQWQRDKTKNRKDIKANANLRLS